MKTKKYRRIINVNYIELPIKEIKVNRRNYVKLRYKD